MKDVCPVQEPGSQISDTERLYRRKWRRSRTGEEKTEDENGEQTAEKKETEKTTIYYVTDEISSRASTSTCSREQGHGCSDPDT